MTWTDDDEAMWQGHQQDTVDAWLGDCPYWAFYYGLGPRGVCSYGCQSEPSCVTNGVSARVIPNVDLSNGSTLQYEALYYDRIPE